MVANRLEWSMRRFWLISAAFAASVAAPSAAWGQAPQCPPGAWFCSGDGEATPPPAPGPSAAPAPLPATPSHAPLYQAGGMPGEYEPPPPPPPRPRRSEWGVQGRVEGVMLDDGKNRDTPRSSEAKNPGMGGIGFSLRPRPSPYFAIDLGFDFVGGTDYNREDRSEMSLMINPMFFINPRNKVQVYVLAGVGFSSARVNHTDGSLDDYSYFGVDTGVGVEWRFLTKLALDVDVIGFVRGRTDRNAEMYPEFTDARTHRTTNASGGGLLRLGLIYYW
jgi:hypothetical protein